MKSKQPTPRQLDKAATAGLSDRTLNRAKQHLRIKSNKQPHQWTWQLPPTSSQADNPP